MRDEKDSVRDEAYLDEVRGEWCGFTMLVVSGRVLDALLRLP
jgi:hypothetical protein